MGIDNVDIATVVIIVSNIVVDFNAVDVTFCYVFRLELSN